MGGQGALRGQVDGGNLKQTPKEWGKLKRVTVSPGMAEGDTIQLLFPYITGKQIDEACEQGQLLWDE